MYLLRTEVGLSARRVGELVGRSPSTVLDLSQLVARGERAGDLVARVRQALGIQVPSFDVTTAGWTSRAVPGLTRARLAAGLSQDELAERAQVARETVIRIERGRPAQVATIRRLTAALSLPPSVLEGATDRGDHPTHKGPPRQPGCRHRPEPQARAEAPCCAPAHQPRTPSTGEARSTETGRVPGRCRPDPGGAGRACRPGPRDGGQDRGRPSRTCGHDHAAGGGLAGDAQHPRRRGRAGPTRPAVATVYRVWPPQAHPGLPADPRHRGLLRPLPPL